MLASASADNSIKLWDVKSGKLIRNLEGHKAAFLSICFSKDDKTLVSGSIDKTGGVLP